MTVEFRFTGEAPATPRDAATVLVLREGDGAPEIFFVKRSADARFMGNAYVFPGGRLDPADREPGIPCDLTPHEAALRLGDDDPARALALHIAALRECLEESGIVIATGPVAADVAAALREALAPRAAPPLAALFNRYGITLAARSLVPLSRWVTPRLETRRFDARFFLARAVTRHEAATHDGSETVASAWLTPADALARVARGEIVLAPPTWRTLEALRHARSVDEALACAPAAIEAVEPTVILEGDAPCVVLPKATTVDGSSALTMKFLYKEGSWVAIG
jgi:8-oxo-dGTP pyrophosphatase MutT (NUDIX family)